MPSRLKRFLLALVLVTPVAIVGLNSPPFVQSPHAQGGFTGRMFGPNFPGLMDTSGDGMPGAGDKGIVPTRAGNVITLSHPLDCNPNDTDNQFTLGGDLFGKMNTVSRNSDFGRTQEIDVLTGNGGRATRFGFTERKAGVPIGTAVGEIQDTNGDGSFENFFGNGSTAAGKSDAVFINWVFADTNGDGFPDYVSIPWSWASQLGVDFGDNCKAGGSGGTDPQIWIPLADGDGDGHGDSVVPDLDGNGSADFDLFASPPLVSAAVPTMSATWMTALTLVLAGAALWVLRRRETPLA